MKEEEYNYQIINRKKMGIYIHVPFCKKKCLYCDFFSGGGKDVDWEKFVAAILNELEERADEVAHEVSTLYIGGGTPSLMPPHYLRLLAEQVKHRIDKGDEWDEFTLEVNPEDVTEENCEVWKETGVNRISMGIQTLDDSELHKIGRIHDSATAMRSLRILKDRFNNVSVDLIFGLPDQTIESWQATVNKVLEYEPEHISAYSLMFEEGTAMSVLKQQNRLTFPDEDECVEMWGILTDLLESKSYQQYELSNYALKGHESVHNQRYWLGNPYIGLGPSAHSYDGGVVRRGNRNSIRDYIERFSQSDSKEPAQTPFYIEDRLGVKELIEEKIMLSLRMARGINLKAYGDMFGKREYERLMRSAERTVKSGRLMIESGRLHLTKKGIMVADDIILDLCP